MIMIEFRFIDTVFATIWISPFLSFMNIVLVRNYSQCVSNYVTTLMKFRYT